MNHSLDFIVRVYDLKTLESSVGQLSYKTNVRWSCDSLYLFDHKGSFIESYVSLCDMHSQVCLASWYLSRLFSYGHGLCRNHFGIYLFNIWTQITPKNCLWHFVTSLAGFFNHFLLFGEMVVVRVVHCTMQSENKTELFQFI